MSLAQVIMGGGKLLTSHGSVTSSPAITETSMGLSSPCWSPGLDTLGFTITWNTLRSCNEYTYLYKCNTIQHIFFIRYKILQSCFNDLSAVEINHAMLMYSACSSYTSWCPHGTPQISESLDYPFKKMDTTDGCNSGKSWALYCTGS